MKGLSEVATLFAPLRERWRRPGDGAIGKALVPLVERLRGLGLLAAPTRFVLIVGDEGTTLVHFNGRQVVDAMFVGPEAEDGFGTLREAIDRDPQAEVLVAADVLEQMYRNEQLPRVGRFDRLTIVKRRLDIAYPHDRLKAALPLESGKDGGGSFLFAALPVTTSIEQWIEFFEGLPNPVIGFCLLPLESVNIASRLAPSAEGDGRRVWRALVSQQAPSGFRQIFESDGELVVTRLTQRPPGDLSAEAVALLIERELRSSISYIKRLGYTDFDRLDLVVLGNRDVCAAVEARDLPVTSTVALTPRQAEAALGFVEVGPEDSPFGDILHAQWLEAKRRPVAVLPTDKLRARLKTEQAFKIGFVAAAALTVFTVLYISSILFDLFDSVSTAQSLQEMVATERQAVALAHKKLERFPIPVDVMTQVVDTEAALAKRQIDPTTLLHGIAAALDASARVQKVVISYPSPDDGKAAPPSRGRRPAPRKAQDFAYEVHLVLRFGGPGAAEPDAVLRQAKDARERLQQALPDHEVSLVRLPLSQLRSRILEGTAGAAQSKALSGPPTAEYLIRKKA